MTHQVLAEPFWRIERSLKQSGVFVLVSLHEARGHLCRSGQRMSAGEEVGMRTSPACPDHLEWLQG